MRSDKIAASRIKASPPDLRLLGRRALRDVAELRAGHELVGSAHRFHHGGLRDESAFSIAEEQRSE